MSPWLLPLLLAHPAQAEVRRFAVVAANNEGGMVYRSLSFAEDDARKLRDVLVEVGGYDEADVRLVLEASRGRVQDAFDQARRDVARARAEGDEVVFLFYWSGHGDEGSLLMGDSDLSYDELEALLAETGADVKVALLDACHSGAAVREKGGTRVPAFEVALSERLGTSGTVFITSSTGDEASQESDEIGGSYFTHYLASGLYGAADVDADRVVTLSEAYAFVYNETVMRTSATRIGTQHPTFEWALSGEGDLVLAELDPARGTLDFGAALDGSFAVFDLSRRVYVAEVAEAPTGQAPNARRVHLPPGRYQVRRRLPTHLRVAEVTVRDGQAIDVATLPFHAMEYEDDAAKGAIEARLRRAAMPDSALRLGLGVLGADGRAVREGYLPDIPVAVATWRLYWRDGRWASAELWGGVGGGTLDIAGTTTLDAGLAGAGLGAAAGYATPPRALQAGLGLRVDALWLGRSFDPAQGVPGQHLSTLAPGLDAWVGARHRRLEAELSWREHLVPVALDGEIPLFTLHQALLVAGYRF